MRGILPISQSSFPEGHGNSEKQPFFEKNLVRAYVPYLDGKSDQSCLADFPLTGSGENYQNCGSYFTVGCLNVEKHVGTNLDGVNMDGKAYLERHKQSCHRPLCPICWEDWANREKDVASDRLEAFVLKGRNLKPIHLTVSVPHEDYVLPPQIMKEKARKALKVVHCIGGMMVYHPKRKNALSGWYFSPHFHVIGYGWIMDIRQNYVNSGYIIRNIGIRKTVEGTIFYQLSHCGISPKHHAITWFGALSYAKLHVQKREKEVENCPICGNKLKKLIWIGEGEQPLPDIEGVAYFDDPKNWLEKPKKQLIRWDDIL